MASGFDPLFKLDFGTDLKLELWGENDDLSETLFIILCSVVVSTVQTQIR